MTRALPILLACLLCAIARGEATVRTLVVGDVVVAEGIDWIAWDAPPESVELLQGVVIDGVQAAPHRASGTVVLRLSEPTTIRLWSGADDPLQPARSVLEWSPQLEPSRIDELIGRIAAIESRLEQLTAGTLPQPPPPPEPLRVDPNTASIEELVRLPGIGPALAQRIVDAREHVVFREASDLTLVKGIGAATVAGFAEFLMFEAEPPEDEFEGAEEADEQPSEPDESEQTMSTPYLDAVLALSPVAHYRLNETSGTTIVDASGNSNDGTYVGPTLGGEGSTSDADDGSAGFDGVDDRGDVPEISTNTGTMIAWIRTTSSGTQYIFAGSNTANTLNAWLIALNADGVPYAQRQRHWTTTATGETPINDGEWHMVVGVVEHGVPQSGWRTVTLYVDGTVAAVVEHDGEGAGNGTGGINTLTIGSRMTSGAYGGFFLGDISNATYFARALTAQEVADLYAAAASGEPEPSTISGDAPSASWHTGDATLAPGAAAMSGSAPSASWRTAAAGLIPGASTLTGNAPSAAWGVAAATINTAGLELTGDAPSAAWGVGDATLAPGALAVGGDAPSAGWGVAAATLAPGGVVMAGEAPRLTWGVAAAVLDRPREHALAPDERRFYVPAEARTFVVPADDRVLTVPFEERVFVVER